MRDHFQEAKQLVIAALELPSEQRSAYLEHACGGDEALRAEVESLLGADTARIAFVDSPPLRILPETTAPPAEPEIGAYRIVRELGRGGMGVVYLGRRTDEEFEHQVAIKVLKRGMDADEIAARFRRERQILANLNHPNIAHLFEGGRTPDGRLYFLLEYVEGEPIDAYCEHHGLSVEQRLNLVLKVCSAVEHAHRNLVVHRDLKPRNILVTADGEPKLLDFGIAKLLQAEDDAAASVTSAPWRFLTLDYASPEQVHGDTITTASDVYSLGVLLYQLLAGRKPYESAGRSEPEVLQTITAETPEKPSVAVRSGATATGTTGTTRSLSRRLAGDLDTIVLKALRKEPERRYGSVAELAEDLRRHLDGLPVQAQSDTWGYRAGKFVRRNKAVLALISLIFLITLAFAVAMAVQVREKERERVRAERVVEFIVDLFASASPDQAQGSDPKLTDLIRGAQTQLVWTLSNEPLDRAEILDTLGRLFQELGSYDDSERLLSEALTIRQDLLGAQAEDTISSAQNLGVLFLRSGRYDDAEKRLRSVLEAQRKNGHPPKEIAETLIHLGMLLELRKDLDQAQIVTEEAAELTRAALGRNSREYASSLNTLATIKQTRGDFDGAESLFREALSISQEIFGERHPEPLSIHDNLGLLLYYSGRPSEALSIFEQNLPIEEDIFGESHIAVLTTMNNLALTYGALGDHEREGAVLKTVTERILTHYGESHPYYAQMLHNLGRNYNAREEWSEAEPILKKAIILKRTQLGTHHPSVATSLNSLASTLSDLDRFSEAEEIYEEARAIYEAAFGRTHPDYAAVLHNISHAYRRQGYYEQARYLAEEAQTILIDSVGTSHPSYRSVLFNLARIEILDADVASAERAARELVSLIQEDPEAKPDELQRAHDLLGEILSLQERRE